METVDIMHIKRILTYLGAFLSFAGIAAAATYHVETTGDDANTGLTRDHAFQTLAKALSAATGGDLILVGEGTFSSTVQLVIDKGVEIRGSGLDKTILTTPQTDNGAGYRTIDIDHADALLSDVTISGGKAAGGDAFGLALRIRGNGGTVTRCRITGNKDNQAHVRGTVNLNSDAATLSYCVIDHNVLAIGNGRGAGVYLQRGTVENCLIFRNTSVFGGGFAIEHDSGKLIVRNCTITANEATANAGGLFLRKLANGPGNKFQNVVLAGNRLPKDTLGRPPEWSRENTDDQGLLERFTAIAGSCHFGANDPIGTGSIAGDPVFTDPAHDDYTFRSTSPAIDAGVAYDPMGATDLAGAPRLSGDRIDIGCYEFDTSCFSCGFEAAPLALFQGDKVAISPRVYGVDDPRALSYVWTLTSPRGATITADEASPVVTIPDAGVYDVTREVTDGRDGKTTSAARTGYIQVAARTNYLAAAGASAPAFPWDTPETAGNDLAELLAATFDGAVILLGEGTFSLTNQLLVTKAVTLIGSGIDKTILTTPRPGTGPATARSRSTTRRPSSATSPSRAGRPPAATNTGSPSGSGKRAAP